MSNCKALDAELAMAQANTDMARTSAIHTQVLSVEKLENMGLSDLANGARNMLAKMLEMPEQAPKHMPSEQADTCQMSPSKDEAGQPEPPVHLLSPSEYEVAKLLHSRLWKVLNDLPNGRGYHELSVEQLQARLSDEIVEFDRTKVAVKKVADEIERRGRIGAAVKALNAEGIQVVFPLA